MSLVAYASSDSSDGENEKDEKITDESSVTSSQVLSKKREPKKISIPSLKEFKDEDPDEVPKKQITYKGGSSLLGMLPQPKNCTTLSKPGFTPYILSKKQDAKKSASKPSDDIKKTPPFTSSSKVSSTPPKDNKSAKLEKEEDDDDVVTSSDVAHSESLDFFSLNTDRPSFKPVDRYVVNEQTVEVPVPAVSFDEAEVNFAAADTSRNLPEPGGSNYDEQPELDDGSSYISAVGSSEDLPTQEPSLSDEGFLKLRGRRRKPEDVNIIDVKVDDQLTDRNEMLMKSLTQESEHRPFKRRHDMPTQQQKRKHQITYLAFQAKEREMDLKNQWALNSRTRRETQAKYGF